MLQNLCGQCRGAVFVFTNKWNITVLPRSVCKRVKRFVLYLVSYYFTREEPPRSSIYKGRFSGHLTKLNVLGTTRGHRYKNVKYFLLFLIILSKCSAARYDSWFKYRRVNSFRLNLFLWCQVNSVSSVLPEQEKSCRLNVIRRLYNFRCISSISGTERAVKNQSQKVSS